MANDILLINAAGGETRVALVENGSISEYYIERKRDLGIVGNIYKGKVVRVLPGMQAAFVDIGLDKAAFLYVRDVFYDPDFSEQEFDLTEGERAEREEAPAPEQIEEAEALAQLEKAQAEQAAPAEAGREPTEVTPIPLTEVIAESPPSAGSPSKGDEAETATATEAPPAAPPEQGSLSAPRPAQAAREVPAPGGQRRRRRHRRGKGREGKPDGEERARDGALEGRREGGAHAASQAQIQDLLKEGQEIIVQVVKDPIGTKGARVTSHISLPGRHLVFMPTVDHVGISRRIDEEGDRRRLRDIVNRMRPPGTGFIVRTVADTVNDEKIAADIRFLIQVWNDVGREKDKKPAPALLHSDLDIVLRATRDLFTHEVEKLVIDDRDEYERVVAFVEAQEPALKDHVELYAGEEAIFDSYGIEPEIRRALNRKVWLKSGGYIIIDQAEALVAIDVNSGRYVGKKNLEETITRINVEAAKEIVYQLRLRNIGGIIIIDFIDMDKPQNRDKVFKALQEALGRDRAKTNVLKISELGLVEMTRKRVRESLGRTLNEPCPTCDGKGTVRSRVTVAYDIFREIRRQAPNMAEQILVVNCHPEVAKLIATEERDELRHLMDRCNKSIQVKPQPSYRQEQFDMYGRANQPASRPATAGANP